jgi:hypothetical protein
LLAITTLSFGKSAITILPFADCRSRSSGAT